MNEAPTYAAELLIRLRDPGDEQAWSEFTEIYGPLVYQLAKRRGFRRPTPKTWFRRSSAPSPGPSSDTTPTRPGARSGAGSRGSPAT